MATKQEQNLILRLYPALRYVGEQADETSNTIIRLTEMNLESERNHRRLSPDGWRSKNFDVATAARYWTLRDVFKGLGDNSTITTGDILQLKTTILIARAFAREYAHLIEENFTQDEINSILALDYGKMME